MYWTENDDRKLADAQREVERLQRVKLDAGNRQREKIREFVKTTQHAGHEPMLVAFIDENMRGLQQLCAKLTEVPPPAIDPNWPDSDRWGLPIPATIAQD